MLHVSLHGYCCVTLCSPDKNQTSQPMTAGDRHQQQTPVSSACTHVYFFSLEKKRGFLALVGFRETRYMVERAGGSHARLGMEVRITVSRSTAPAHGTCALPPEPPSVQRRVNY